MDGTAALLILLLLLLLFLINSLDVSKHVSHVSKFADSEEMLSLAFELLLHSINKESTILDDEKSQMVENALCPFLMAPSIGCHF